MIRFELHTKMSENMVPLAI